MKKQILRAAIALSIIRASAAFRSAVVSKLLILNNTLVESRLKFAKLYPRKPGKGTNTPKSKPGPPPKR